jgi:hypothetical protein
MLDLTLQALRADAVDDVHISAHYASILDNHMKSLRSRFVAMSNPVVSDISRAPSNFEPCTRPVGNLTECPNATDMSSTEFENWMMLPFDAHVSEPFEQAVMQNVYGVDMSSASTLFWQLLP